MPYTHYSNFPDMLHSIQAFHWHGWPGLGHTQALFHTVLLKAPVGKHGAWFLQALLACDIGGLCLSTILYPHFFDSTCQDWFLHPCIWKPPCRHIQFPRSNCSPLPLKHTLLPSLPGKFAEKEEKFTSCRLQERSHLLDLFWLLAQAPQSLVQCASHLCYQTPASLDTSA